MAQSDAHKAASRRWDAANMGRLSLDIRKELLEAFRQACRDRGDAAAAVLRRAMEKYIAEGPGD